MGRGKNQSEGKSSYYKRNSRKEGKTTKSVSESDHGRLKSLFVRGMNLLEKNVRRMSGATSEKNH